MITTSRADPAHVNRVSLCEETLTVVGPLIGAIGYACLALIQVTPAGQKLPFSATLAACALIVSGVAAYFLRKRQQTWAMGLLVWGTFIGTLLAVISLRSPATSYLLTVPVILANSLLRRRLVMAVALCALTFVLFIAPVLTAASPAETLSAATVLTLVTITAWMASRNVQTTLSWLSRAYDTAWHNEALVRERSAELQRAFKALDEATTRLDRANVMLAYERNQADEARRLKQQFAQTISHELRTPLNLVVAFTDLMAHSPELYGAPLPPAYMRDLTVVQRNASHLQTLVNDVLELSQIEAAQVGLVLEQAQPEAIVNDAVNMVRGLAEAHHLTLETDVALGLPPVWVDATRIRQVLINFLNNAIKFTEGGGMVVRAQLSDAGDRIVFSVADTGPGIAAEHLPRLFEEFSQLDSGTRRKHGGTGLGLAISKRFVQLHAGNIWAESTPGIGSTFFFDLPICEDASHPRPCWDERTARLPYSGDQIVLVVTRSAFAASLLSRHLRGCHIVVAEDLISAQAQAKQVLPRMIVFDTASAPLDGAQMQRFLAECDLTNTMALACPLPGEDLIRQQLGAHQYLIKPVTRDRVLAAIETANDVVRRVLVIDDDEDFVRLLRRFLDGSARGYRIAGAHSGAEGLALLPQLRPDVVVLDMQLPDIGGAQVAERIRATPGFAHVPIVVISAQEITPALDLSRASVFMSKANGFAPGDLIRVIERMAHFTIGVAS
jgi:signal transduction histidine kinase/CheY-like chemotaxis protein